jgi:hypothetical protein
MLLFLESFNLHMHRFAKVQPRVHKPCRDCHYPIYNALAHERLEQQHLINDHGKFLRLQQQLQLQQKKRNFDLHNKEEIFRHERDLQLQQRQMNIAHQEQEVLLRRGSDSRQ